MSEIPIIWLVDTNVLVPSLYSLSPIARFLVSGNLILVWSPFIFEEAITIINRLADRYYRKASVQPEKVIELLALLTEAGIEVDDMPADWPPRSIDRKDDPFLWAGDAEYVISDDLTHMLKLGSFQWIPIGRPGDFFQWVKTAHPMSTPEW